MNFKLNNPLRVDSFNMQDIRGGQYALMPPVDKILRAEGFCYLALSAVLYGMLGFHWWQFAAWFLLPDIAVLAYVFSKHSEYNHFAAHCYNFTHSSIGASLIGLIGLLTLTTNTWDGARLCIQISLIWFAHIGFDRALGYGLKYGLGFRVTHLGVLSGMTAKE